jgi:holliday junction DNA helicase RuvA
MIAQLRGKLLEKQPSQVIIECGGVGYEVQISINTYNKLGNSEECKLLIHYSVSIDVRSGASNHQLFGFATPAERELFRLLISISGVSSNIARTILSFLSPEELQKAVVMGDINRLKSVKGIGPKLAQRVIAELQEKKGKSELNFDNLAAPHNTVKSEALIALCSLGFDRLKAEQALEKTIQDKGNDLAVEELIKFALRLM